MNSILPHLSRRSFARFGAAAATAAAMGAVRAAGTSARAQGAAGPIKIGILHSLSGTMAISETTLKDVMLMLIEKQNKAGGVLGRKLEAVVVDPASNWPLFAEKARQLISVDKCAATFGCWTSVSRKSVLPVFEELNSILFYPVQYEGQECSRNVFYTGAAPNQQAIPAVDYLWTESKVKRWVLAGTDYVYPRTTNQILEAYLKSRGVAAEDIVGASQHPALHFTFVPKIIDRGDRLLVWRGARVKHVAAAFLPLILHRIKQDGIQFLEHRQDGLAGNGGPAAEGRGTFVNRNQLARLFREQRPV